MKIEVKIEGVTPLIFNRFTDKAAEDSTSGNRGAQGGDRGTPLEIAHSKLYFDAYNKKIVVPQPNLLRCLVEGGRFHKIGKTQITTERKSILYSCLDIEGADIELIHKQPWKVDTRAVRIPATGGRILAHRPMFDDWTLEFIVDLDTSIIGVKLLRMIVDDAGKRIGLGDFRPATKGPFGKFCVTLWQEIQELPSTMQIAAE